MLWMTHANLLLSTMDKAVAEKMALDRLVWKVSKVSSKMTVESASFRKAISGTDPGL